MIPTHLMIKLNIPESSSYMFPFSAIVLSQQYCRITVIVFCTFTCNAALYSVTTLSWRRVFETDNSKLSDKTALLLCAIKTA